MNNKQKKVMWSAIVALILCLLFPVSTYTTTWSDPGVTRRVKNPQYGMTKEEWREYIGKFTYNDRHIPQDIYESGNWKKYYGKPLPVQVMEKDDWGVWKRWNRVWADDEFVTLSVPGEKRYKDRKRPNFIFNVSFDDVNILAWIIEVIVIGLVAGGLWVQFKDE